LSSVATRFAWLPSAAVGAAGAAAAEMAVGLLLYARGGFLGALTLILCAEAAALAFGLWSAPQDSAPPWPGMRRAWFVLVLSLVLGAALAASWEALGGLSATWLTRGLGLACLAALPLYGTGAVLGASALTEGDPPAPVGSPAAAGAVVGFALVGAGRSALMIAPLAYVGGIVLVSVAALLHGRMLEEREHRWREWAARGAAHGDEEIAARPPMPPHPPSIPASSPRR
jgi:hypothetical protein